MNEVQLDGFGAMPLRLFGEREERIAQAAKRLHYFIPFLDDYLRGLMPHDLVIIGAPSGVGKTEVAMQIASGNAFSKKRVNYFALEAEPRELERRTKFSLLSNLLYRYRSDAGEVHPERDRMNYTDWYMGDLDAICAPFERQADQQVLEMFSGMRTYYRGARFTIDNLEAGVMAVHANSDLIVVDHLHYLDGDDDENENRAIGKAVKTIRDISLRIGVPIILVAHLRKRDVKSRQLVAGLDDFHGSSNIVKIATQVIVLERAPSIPVEKWWRAPTFFTIPKDRRGGACTMVAVADFDLRTKRYGSDYSLGRITDGAWQVITDRPSWAKSHVHREIVEPVKKRSVRP